MNKVHFIDPTKMSANALDSLVWIEEQYYTKEYLLKSLEIYKIFKTKFGIIPLPLLRPVQRY